MSSTSSVMGSRQAAELDHALERNGWTAGDVKKLSSGDTLARILSVIRGNAEVVIKRHLIDCDADPFVPNGWKVEAHKKGGQFEWDPTKVSFHLSPNQMDGHVIEGNKLRNELANEPVLNANVLDYLLAHANLIPEEWKVDEKRRTRYIFFWGTIYRLADGGLCVRYLYWRGDGWHWGTYWLGYGWYDYDPAARLAS